MSYLMINGEPTDWMDGKMMNEVLINSNVIEYYINDFCRRNEYDRKEIEELMKVGDIDEDYWVKAIRGALVENKVLESLSSGLKMYYRLNKEHKDYKPLVP